jgi:hypothetical protein
VSQPWVELDPDVLEDEIEKSLQTLALEIMRDPNRDTRLAVAANWHKVEAEVRAAYELQTAKLQSRLVREGDRLQ